MSNSSSWLLIQVTDLKTGNKKATVKIPASLANFGMKMAAKFAPAGIEGLDMDQLVAAMKNGGEGELVDVVDEEKGEHVEIFVEWDSSNYLQSFAHQDPAVISSGVSLESDYRDRKLRFISR
ncbi:MAG: hypothetical protein A2Y88_11100 [Chloroflexi bacterium RBG_13_48_10]|nr:MAG: hypothetical protein A2Y88_11100 [Chloroflexi bacterium RBG_13_48_10]